MQGYLEHVDTLNARHFVVAIRKLADTLSYGTDRSRFLGSGIEYVQSRPYQYGDPVRSIDWRVTARTARVHVKEFEAPKRVPVFLLLDTSASMAQSSTRRSKYGLALHVAGGLALACLERVSPVGVVGVGDRDLLVRPSLSKDRILKWLLELRRYRFDEGTTLARRILELRPSLKSRSLVIALSDLHEPEGVDALRLLAQSQDCVALQLQDPAEVHLRGAGLVRAREAETGRTFVAPGRRVGIDQVGIERKLRRGGVDHLVIRTDMPFEHRLRHFFQARGLLGQRVR